MRKLGFFFFSGGVLKKHFSPRFPCVGRAKFPGKLQKGVLIKGFGERPAPL
ncbi:hypothetical protein EBI_26784 [Enterocytozoon bieneusi H348]|nr:hypothetical protein EBI_26784 [Enterocytozoon bieneusi H348]|eukprot:XP_002650766.1 hypothetical protein EBI_26784 [Enterocytozoon bieneusi H348]